jgi:hypothetical protein
MGSETPKAKLGRLLTDPHPGLFAWNEAVWRQINALRAQARDEGLREGFLAGAQKMDERISVEIASPDHMDHATPAALLSEYLREREGKDG